MNCPVCTAELLPQIRLGVEIDHCPRCRGIWLDRGELDKLLHRAAEEGDDWDDARPAYSPPAGHHPSAGHPRKRKSFWKEIFDFD